MSAQLASPNLRGGATDIGRENQIRKNGFRESYASSGFFR